MPDSDAALENRLAQKFHFKNNKDTDLGEASTKVVSDIEEGGSIVIYKVTSAGTLRVLG